MLVNNLKFSAENAFLKIYNIDFATHFVVPVFCRMGR
jgi:hypothetical protein